MPRFTRRKLLQLGVTSTSLGIAGCSNPISSDSDEIHVEMIDVTNFDATTRTINILLVDNGEPVYWDVAELEAWDVEEQTGSGIVVFEQLPEEPGEYILYAWLDQHQRSEWVEYDLVERRDVSCTNITLYIGDADQENYGEIQAAASLGCSNDEGDSET